MRKLFLLALASTIAFFGACSDDSSSAKDSLEESSSSSVLAGDTAFDYNIISKDDTTRNTFVDSIREYHHVGKSALRITEISPTNLDYLDQYGEDPGWVEIYNAGKDTANLRGYSILEKIKADSPRKWVIDSLLIPPGTARIVFCSGKDVRSQPKGVDADGKHYRLHTNWKLDKDSGSVYLVDYNWGIRDSVINYPALKPGTSWGIINGGEWRYFAKPTPDKKNTASVAFEGYTEPVGLIPSGFFAEEFTLQAPTPTSGGVIRCTFDGSEPTEKSEPFTDSRRIDENTVVRCAEYADGKIPNTITTATYFVNETVNMPVVAVSVGQEFVSKLKITCSEPDACKKDSYKKKLYEDVEYPVHVEYFADGSSSKAKAFEIDAGISLMGNWSRVNEKKSAAIVMREQYQDGKLHYPLFETRKETSSSIKGFNLRNNGNRYVSDYLEDAMAGALMEGTEVDYQRSRQVVVFYNGKYDGIHDMRERYNKAFVENNHKGINANEVNMVKHLGREIKPSDPGDDVAYKSMLSFIASHDFSGSNNDSYKTLPTHLDIGAYADYMIAEMYIHNADWPANNVRAWRTPKQSWRFMVYDLDHGFDWAWPAHSSFSSSATGTNMFNWVKQGGSPSASCANNTSVDCFHNIFVKLLKNPDFTRLYANHAAVLLQNNLNAGKVDSVLTAMASTLVKSETDRDLDTFKRSYVHDFSISGSSMKAWAKERDPYFWNEIIKEFKLGEGSIGVTLSSSGSGYILLDEMKLPRNPYVGKFFNGNKMLLTAVPTGSSVFQKWEDGSTDNPRLITPADGKTYTATFK